MFPPTPKPEQRGERMIKIDSIGIPENRTKRIGGARKTLGYIYRNTN